MSYSKDHINKEASLRDSKRVTCWWNKIWQNSWDVLKHWNQNKEHVQIIYLLARCNLSTGDLSEAQMCNLAWSLVFQYVWLDSSDEQICRWKGYDPTSHTIEGMARADVLITSLSSLSWTAAVLNPGLVLHPSPGRKASPKATHLALDRRVMRVGMMIRNMMEDERFIVSWCIVHAVSLSQAHDGLTNSINLPRTSFKISTSSTAQCELRSCG